LKTRKSARTVQDESKKEQ